jgi:hypothetical protein
MFACQPTINQILVLKPKGKHGGEERRDDEIKGIVGEVNGRLKRIGHVRGREGMYEV